MNVGFIEIISFLFRQNKMEFQKWTFYLVIWVVLMKSDFGICSSLNSVNKPNIILIVADDLGFNDVPWHNNEVIAPNIQKLASEGVILENSYVQPVCSPTRSALLSGRYPFTIGRQDDVIWPLMPTGLTLDVPIIPQLLKPLGYDTHSIGKWHLGFCNWSYTPTERGFDTFHGFYTGSEDYYSHMRNYYYYNDDLRYKELQGLFNANTSINHEDQTGYKGNWKHYSGYDFRNNRQPDFQAQGTYSSFLFASYVEEILRSSGSGNPKFLYVPFQNVHSPLQVPDKYLIPYKYIRDKKRKTYLGMVSAIDEAIGRIVKALKESGRYKNSVIIFTSDNGGPTISGANNWPLRGNKTTLWEGGTRGAAFIHSPLLKNPGRISYNLIHTTDWLSTIVGLAGGNAPNDTDSVDQWEALNEIKDGPRKEMIYNINNNKHIGFQAAIRVKYYKLLVGNPGPGEWTPPPLIPKRISWKSKFFRSDVFSSAKNWSTSDNLEFIKNLKTNCKSVKCFRKALRDYQKSEGLNIEGKALIKIMDLIKRYKSVFKKWLKSNDENELRNRLNDFKPSVDHQTKLPENYISSLSNSNIFKEMFTYNITIRLFNLKDDPEEKNDLSKDKPAVVDYLLKRLLSYRNRWVDPDLPKDDPRGDPSNWGGVWSPGWC